MIVSVGGHRGRDWEGTCEWGGGCTWKEGGRGVGNRILLVLETWLWQQVATDVKGKAGVT